MASFFKDRGYDVKVSFNNFDETAKAYEANIIYINLKPIGHFVAVKYEDQKFWGINTFCKKNSEFDYSGNQISVFQETLTNGSVNTFYTKILISVSPKTETTDSSQ